MATTAPGLFPALTLQAQPDVGQGLQSSDGNRLAALLASPVGPCVESAQRVVELGEAGRGRSVEHGLDPFLHLASDVFGFALAGRRRRLEVFSGGQLQLIEELRPVTLESLTELAPQRVGGCSGVASSCHHCSLHRIRTRTANRSVAVDSNDALPGRSEPWPKPQSFRVSACQLWTSGSVAPGG
jgi:hypothetical protein